MGPPQEYWRKRWNVMCLVGKLFHFSIQSFLYGIMEMTPIYQVVYVMNYRYMMDNCFIYFSSIAIVHTWSSVRKCQEILWWTISRWWGNHQRYHLLRLIYIGLILTERSMIFVFCFVGQRGLYKTMNGLQVAYLSGHFDQDKYNDTGNHDNLVS